MKSKLLFLPMTMALCQVFTPVQAASSSHAQLNRTALPIPEPIYKSITELDARKAKAPNRFQVKAPEGSPNINTFAKYHAAFA